MTKTLLITGVKGYIGRHVVQCFYEHGWTASQLCLVDIGEPVGIPEPLQEAYVNCNVLEQAESEKLWESLGRAEIVLHLAWRNGFNHKAGTHLEDLPRHVAFLENMVKSGCRSVAVMGTMHECGYWEGAITADTPCSPLSKYGIAKNALRQATLLLCQEYQVDCKWLRAYYITGDDAAGQSLFSRIVGWEKEGKTTFPFTSGINKYDFLDISQLAYQIMRAVAQDKINGIINICSGVPMSLKDRVEAFLAEHKFAIRPEYGAFPDRPYDSPGCWGDPSLINAILADCK